jgi:hypothetical protein
MYIASQFHCLPDRKFCSREEGIAMGRAGHFITRVNFE